MPLDSEVLYPGWPPPHGWFHTPPRLHGCIETARIQGRVASTSTLGRLQPQLQLLGWESTPRELQQLQSGHTYTLGI